MSDLPWRPRPVPIDHTARVAESLPGTRPASVIESTPIRIPTPKPYTPSARAQTQTQAQVHVHIQSNSDTDENKGLGLPSQLVVQPESEVLGGEEVPRRMSDSAMTRSTTRSTSVQSEPAVLRDRASAPVSPRGTPIARRDTAQADTTSLTYAYSTDGEGGDVSDMHTGDYTQTGGVKSTQEPNHLPQAHIQQYSTSLPTAAQSPQLGEGMAAVTTARSNSNVSEKSSRINFPWRRDSGKKSGLVRTRPHTHTNSEGAGDEHKHGTHGSFSDNEQAMHGNGNASGSERAGWVGERSSSGGWAASRLPHVLSSITRHRKGARSASSPASWRKSNGIDMDTASMMYLNTNPKPAEASDSHSGASQRRCSGEFVDRPSGIVEEGADDIPMSKSTSPIPSYNKSALSAGNSDMSTQGNIPDEFNVSRRIVETIFSRFKIMTAAKVRLVRKTPDTPEHTLCRILHAGRDEQFDKVLVALSTVSRHCLKQVVMALIAWWSAHRGVPTRRTSGKGASGNNHVETVTMQKQELAYDYLFGRALIQVFENRNINQMLPPFLAQEIEKRAIAQTIVAERIFKHLGAASKNDVVDLYGQLINVLFETRHDSCTDLFVSVITGVPIVLQDDNALGSPKVSTKDRGEVSGDAHLNATSSERCSLVRAMGHLRMKTFPMKDLEACVRFLTKMGDIFVALKHQSDVKVAMATMLVTVILPLAAVANAEVNLPGLKNFVNTVFPKARKMKTQPQGMRFTTALLCLSPKPVFLERWPPFLSQCLSGLKDSKLQNVSLESIHRCFWIYFYRVKGESAASSVTRLEKVVSKLFPRNPSAGVVPRETPVNVFVELLIMMNELVDFVIKDTVFMLLGIAKDKKTRTFVLHGDRNHVGLKAALEIANYRESKRIPSFAVGDLPAGYCGQNVYTQTLTYEKCVELGLGSHYEDIRNQLTHIIRAVDKAVGQPMLHTTGKPRVVGDGYSDEYALMMLYRTVLTCIPRLMPIGMPLTEVIRIVCSATVHTDGVLAGHALESLEQMVTLDNATRMVVLEEMALFTVTVTNTCPELVQTKSLRMILQVARKMVDSLKHGIPTHDEIRQPAPNNVDGNLTKSQSNGSQRSRDRTTTPTHPSVPLNNQGNMAPLFTRANSNVSPGGSISSHKDSRLVQLPGRNVTPTSPNSSDKSRTSARTALNQMYRNHSQSSNVGVSQLPSLSNQIGGSPTLSLGMSPSPNSFTTHNPNVDVHVTAPSLQALNRQDSVPAEVGSSNFTAADDAIPLAAGVNLNLDSAGNARVMDETATRVYHTVEQLAIICLASNFRLVRQMAVPLLQEAKRFSEQYCGTRVSVYDLLECYAEVIEDRAHAMPTEIVDYVPSANFDSKLAHSLLEDQSGKWPTYLSRCLRVLYLSNCADRLPFCWTVMCGRLLDVHHIVAAQNDLSDIPGTETLELMTGGAKKSGIVDWVFKGGSEKHDTYANKEEALPTWVYSLTFACSTVPLDPNHHLQHLRGGFVSQRPVFVSPRQLFNCFVPLLRAQPPQIRNAVIFALGTAPPPVFKILWEELFQFQGAAAEKHDEGARQRLWRKEKKRAAVRSCVSRVLEHAVDCLWDPVLIKNADLCRELTRYVNETRHYIETTFISTTASRSMANTPPVSMFPGSSVVPTFINTQSDSSRGGLRDAVRESMRETVGRNTRTDENVSDGVREDLEFKTHFSVLVAKIMDSMAHAGVISMYFPDTIRFALFHTFGLWSGLAGAQHTHGRSVALTHNSATTTAEGFYFNQHSTTSIAINNTGGSMIRSSSTNSTNSLGVPGSSIGLGLPQTIQRQDSNYQTTNSSGAHHINIIGQYRLRNASIRAMVALFHETIFDHAAVTPHSYLFNWLSNVLGHDDQKVRMMGVTAVERLLLRNNMKATVDLNTVNQRNGTGASATNSPVTGARRTVSEDAANIASKNKSPGKSPLQRRMGANRSQSALTEANKTQPLQNKGPICLSNINPVAEMDNSVTSTASSATYLSAQSHLLAQSNELASDIVQSSAGTVPAPFAPPKPYGSDPDLAMGGSSSLGLDDDDLMLDCVLYLCYRSVHRVASGYFSALAAVIAAAPTTYVTSPRIIRLLNIVLFKTGDQNQVIRQKAIPLMQILGERMIGKGAVSYQLSITSVLPTSYQQSQIQLSKQMASAKPEIAMLIIEEMLKRFDYVTHQGQRMILQCMTPWLDALTIQLTPPIPHNTPDSMADSPHSLSSDSRRRSSGARSVELFRDRRETVSSLSGSAASVDGNRKGRRYTLNSNTSSKKGTPPLTTASLQTPSEDPSHTPSESLERFNELQQKHIYILLQLLAITTHHGESHPTSVEQVWQALCKQTSNIHTLVEFVIQVCLVVATPGVIPSSQKVIVYVGRKEPQMVIKTLMTDIACINHNHTNVNAPIKHTTAHTQTILHNLVAEYASKKDLSDEDVYGSNDETFGVTIDRQIIALLLTVELAPELPQNLLVQNLPPLLHVLFLNMDRTSEVLYTSCKTLLANLIHKLVSRDTSAYPIQDAARTTIAMLTADDDTSLWSKEDLNLDVKILQPLESSLLLGTLVKQVIFLLSPICHKLVEHWSSVAHVWAVSCTSSDHASRSLQTLRALGLSLNGQVLVDFFERLVHCVLEEEKKPQAFVGEVFLTFRCFIEDLSPNGLASFPQLAWCFVILLACNSEDEWRHAAQLLDLCATRISFEQIRPAVIDMAKKWPQFPGVHSLVLKGLTSAKNYTTAFDIMVTLLPLLPIAPDSILDPSGFALPFTLVSLMPMLIAQFECPENRALQLTNLLSLQFEKRGYSNLSKVIMLYAKGSYSKNKDVWAAEIFKYFNDEGPQQFSNGLSLMFAMFEAEAPYKREILLVVALQLRFKSDQRRTLPAAQISALTEDSTSNPAYVLIRALEGECWKDALDVIDKTLGVVQTQNDFKIDYASTPSPVHDVPSSVKSMWKETPENRQTVRLMLKDLIRAQKHTTGTAHEFVSSTTNLFESIVKTETKGSVVPEEMAAPDAAKQRAKNAQITTLLDDFDDFLEEKLPLFDALNDRAEASQTRPIMRANAQRMTKTRG